MYKVLYEHLKEASDVGVCVVDSHSPFLTLTWRDYLPWDIKEVVSKATPPSEDSWVTRGIEILYSPQQDEFYLRDWEHNPCKAQGKIINRLRVIAKDAIIDKVMKWV